MTFENNIHWCRYKYRNK